MAATFVPTAERSELLDASMPGGFVAVYEYVTLSAVHEVTVKVGDAAMATLGAATNAAIKRIFFMFKLLFNMMEGFYTNRSSHSYFETDYSATTGCRNRPVLTARWCRFYGR